MPKTRLFHTLVVCGAALTGGPVVATAAATAAAVGVTVAVSTLASGCDQQQYAIIDMSVPRDMFYATID